MHGVWDITVKYSFQMDSLGPAPAAPWVWAGSAEAGQPSSCLPSNGLQMAIKSRKENTAESKASPRWLSPPPLAAEELAQRTPPSACSRICLMAGWFENIRVREVLACVGQHSVTVLGRWEAVTLPFISPLKQLSPQMDQGQGSTFPTSEVYPQW